MLRDSGHEGDFTLEWTGDLQRTHDRNTRRYAQVAPVQRPAFELAPQTVYLPDKHRRGLLAHEVGHVLDPWGGEDQADAAAARRLGINIAYDRRWPGKGLQVALNPKKECEYLAVTKDGRYVWKKGRFVAIENGLAHIRVGNKIVRVFPKHVRNCPAPERKSPSGRTRATREGKKVPPFKWLRERSGKRNQIVRISMIAKSDGHLIASVKYRKALHNKKKAMIEMIDVDPNYRGNYVATKLYEKVAKEVWKEGRQLYSDLDLRIGSRGFWEKQVRKGRAEKAGKRYRLVTPPPRSLKNPSEYPILPASAFQSVPVPEGTHYPPVNLDPRAAREGLVPLVYKPERVKEKPKLRQAHEALFQIEQLPSGKTVPRSAFADPWDDLLGAAGMSAEVYVLDAEGMLWRLLEVLRDPGPYGTGSLVLQALGPNARRWPVPRVVPIHVVVGSGSTPIVQYKPLKRLPRLENPVNAETVGHVVGKLVGWTAAGATAELVTDRIMSYVDPVTEKIQSKLVETVQGKVNPPWKTPPECDPRATGRPLKVKEVKGGQVRVHVNLHNGCYVVAHRGLVAGYTKSLTLKNVLPKVSQAGWRRCNETKVRNVHAWLEGEFVKASASKPKGKAWRKISYSCKDHGPHFYYTDDGSVFEGAQEVRFVRGSGEGFKQIQVYAKGAPPRRKNPGCGCRHPGGGCSCGAAEAWWLEAPPGCGCP